MNKNQINSPYRFFLIESQLSWKMIWLYDRIAQKTQTTMNADLSVTFSRTLMTALYPASDSLRNKLQEERKIKLAKNMTPSAHSHIKLFSQQDHAGNKSFVPFLL